MDTEKQIAALLEATQNWLRKDNEYLSVAIQRTVEEGYFSFEDVRHSLLVLKDAVNETAVREWINRSGLGKKHNASGQNVLCLHAGNIPLVGFQDAFAAILSGSRYYGKISRKDPYLLPTFLNELKKLDYFSGEDIQWVHNLPDLEGLQAHSLVFAGSEESVPGVKKAIRELEIETPDTRYLIRTAHFSIAYLDSQDSKHMKDLVEGIFRYGGKGCRSVAVVVSPYSLDSIKCELTDYIESFWLDNPQHEEPSHKLVYQHAYNKAIERPQAWLDRFLLQEGGLEMDQDFICYWVEGDEEKTAELAARYGEQIQTVYITRPDVTIPGFDKKVEFLSDVQSPPLYWRPDGVDTLKWLIGK